MIHKYCLVFLLMGALGWGACTSSGSKDLAETRPPPEAVPPPETLPPPGPSLPPPPAPLNPCPECNELNPESPPRAPVAPIPCQTNFTATLALRADSPVNDQYDIPTSCSHFGLTKKNCDPFADPECTHPDLICCTDSSVREAYNGVAGSYPTCDDPSLSSDKDSNGQLMAVYHWKAFHHIPIKIVFEVDENNDCRFQMRADDFPQYQLRNSAMSVSLTIDTGGVDPVDTNLSPSVIKGRCYETAQGIALETNAGEGLRFRIRFFYNSWGAGLYAPFETLFTEQAQVLPPPSESPASLTTGTLTALPTIAARETLMPPTEVQPLSITGRPIHRENWKSFMTLVAATTVPDTSSFEEGGGLLATQLSGAPLTAEFRGDVVRAKDHKPIRSLEDLKYESCGNAPTWSHPFISDYDGDGLDDTDEVKLGTDPRNPATHSFHDRVFLELMQQFQICQAEFAKNQMQPDPAILTYPNPEVDFLKKSGPYKIAKGEVETADLKSCPLYYPDIKPGQVDSKAQFPLVHVMHGSGTPVELTPYLECGLIYHLVSHGFVVSTDLCYTSEHTQEIIVKAREKMKTVYGQDRLGKRVGLVGHSRGGSVEYYRKLLEEKLAGEPNALDIAGYALFADGGWFDLSPMPVHEGHLLYYYEPAREVDFITDEDELDKIEQEFWARGGAPLEHSMEVTAILDEAGDHVRWTVDNLHYYMATFFKQAFSTDHTYDKFLICKQPQARVKSNLSLDPQVDCTQL